MRSPSLLRLFCVASLGALGCSPGPVSPPPPPVTPVTTVLTTSSAAPPPATAAPAASSTAAVTPPRPNIKVLGTVGDITVASYPPTGFDKLKPEERVLAYHLAQAVLAGDPIFTMQTSRYGLPVTQAIIRLLAGKGKLDPALRDKLVEYRLKLFINHGLHDSRTGQKVLPSFSRKEIEDAARALRVAIPNELLAAMFDPKVAPTVTNKTPGKDKDPITESAATHYEGVTSRDLTGFKEQYELNGRIVKKKGKLTEEVYRAGGDGVPAGVAAKELGRVVAHLEDAITVAAPAEKEALKQLVRYFKTGDAEAFRQHDIAWLPQVFPVDYILGFIETYTDVRERKGSFEGFLAIPDPVRDPPLQALARSSLYFEQELPWDAKWKRDSFRAPAASAVTVLAAAADGGPMTFLGVNLPNAQDLREKYGSKNFVALSVMDTREALVGEKTIDEFVPEESRAEIHRCSAYLEYAGTSFHEVTGHGSGKVNPGLSADPSQLLAPYYSAMEEGRAELVADYLSGDPKTVEIGLLPDAGCARIYAQSWAMRQLITLKWVPEGDVAEEDHLRADLIAFGYLKDKGVVTVEERKGKTFFVVKDPDAWRKAVGELLAEHQRIKATADKPALKALVEKYGTRINTKWRDEVLARLKTLALPRGIATLPPMLTPVRDASGKVVDATAEQTTSVTAYMEMLEKASLP